jgi:hypothetical protein
MKNIHIYTLILAFLAMPLYTYAADLSLNGATMTLNGNVAYDNVILTNGAVINIDAYNGNSTSGWINFTVIGDFNLSSGSSINGKGSGYTAGIGTGYGAGLLNGCGAGVNAGGGGASHIGIGGRGSNCSSSGSNRNQTIALVYGDSINDDSGTITMGSGGGSGESLGGAGGASFRVSAKKINIFGNINVSGNDGQGSSGTVGGGGGGSGGQIVISGQYVNLTGSNLVSKGGSGGRTDTGATGGVGGGGGGGIIKVYYNLSFLNITTYNISGGTRNDTPTSAIRNGENGTLGSFNTFNFSSIPHPILVIRATNEEFNTNISVFSVSVQNRETLSVITDSTTSGNLNYTFANFTNGNYVITVSSTGYGQRSYYTTLNENYTITINAYLLLGESGVSVSFFVVDNYNSPTENALINIFRYINGSSVVVGTTATDSSGSGSLPLQSSISYTGLVTHMSYVNVSKVFTTATEQPIKFIFGQGQLPFQFDLPQIRSSAQCQRNNVTRLLRCNATDSSGYVSSFKLFVQQIYNNITFITVCDTTNTTKPTIITCQIPPQNVTYTYRFTANVGTKSYDIVTGTWTFNQQLNFGLIGVFGAFILFSVCSFVFLPNRYGVIVGILFGYLSIVMSWIIGFIRLGDSGLALVITLGLVAGIFVVIISKSDFT